MKQRQHILVLLVMAITPLAACENPTEPSLAEIIFGGVEENPEEPDVGCHPADSQRCRSIG